MGNSINIINTKMDYQIKRLDDWRKNIKADTELTFLDFISLEKHPEDMLIYGMLLFPTLIEVDKCLFLDFSFNKKLYNEWKRELNGNRFLLERTINHVHIYDIFGHCSDDVDEVVFENVGKMLQTAWLSYFKHTFPNKEIEVELNISDEEYGPTLYVYQK